MFEDQCLDINDDYYPYYEDDYDYEDNYYDWCADQDEDRYFNDWSAAAD